MVLPLSTTTVQSWSGADLLQIGPIYPFVGAEPILWVLGLAFWIWFHWTQFRIEAREMQEDAAGANNPDRLSRIVAEEARS